MRDDPPLVLLAPARDCLPTLQQRAQLGDQREGAASAVLRRAGLQPHEAAGEVHLRPAEREDLGAAPPAGDEHELYRVGKIRSQAPADRRDLGRWPHCTSEAMGA